MKTTLQFICLFLLLGIGLGRAQSPCIPGFTYSQAPNGGTNFTITPPVYSSTATPLYLWQFTNGSGTSAFSGTSTTQSFSLNPGVYVATLTYSVNGASPCNATTTQTVYIANCNMSIWFSATPNPSNSTVIFTNYSTGMSAAATCTWNFGDGNSTVTNNSTNPTHTYATPGTYTVLLSIDNNSVPTCSSVSAGLVTTNTSSVAPCPILVDFSMTPSGTPQVWNATPSFSGAASAGVTWSWGDGSISNTLYTSHTYSAAGMYTICLTTTAVCGWVNSACYITSIYRSSEDLNIITLNVINPSGSTGLPGIAADNMAFTLAPNPGNGNFQLNMSGISSSQAQVQVYSLTGQLVYDKTLVPANGQLEQAVQLNPVASGIYIMKVSAGSQVLNKKLIVQAP